MKSYLLVCNHRKQVVFCQDGDDPKILFKCTKCAMFILQLGEWNFKDIRVYEATTKDIEIVGGGKSYLHFPSKTAPLLQTDWINDECEKKVRD